MLLLQGLSARGVVLMVPCSAGAWHPSTEHTPLNLSLPSFSLNPILPQARGGIFSYMMQKRNVRIGQQRFSPQRKAAIEHGCSQGTPRALQ